MRSEFDEERDGNVAEKDLALVSMTPDDLITPTSRDEISDEDSKLVEDLQVYYTVLTIYILCTFICLICNKR
jgi:hypothetical protein